MNGWVLCDGTNGTPDLTGRLIRMATLGLKDPKIMEHNINERGGSDINSITSEINRSPYELVRYIMKKTTLPRKLKYGSVITIKTDKNVFLHHNASNNKLDESQDAGLDVKHNFIIEELLSKVKLGNIIIQMNNM